MRLNKTKLYLRMAKLCISQKQLAERTSISRQTLSAVMNGRSCRPEILGQIAKALEVEPEQIIE